MTFLSKHKIWKKKKLQDTCKSISAHRENIINKKKIVSEILSKYTFMKSIDTLEKLQKKMQTTFFWANEWVIATIERLLNIKLILLDANLYNHKELYNVLGKCINDSIITNRKKFDPDYYILLEKNHDSYKLVGYKQKQIFTFAEIPYDIKLLICNRCAEKREGCLYSFIEDFNTFLKKENKHYSIYVKRCKDQKERENFCDSTLQNLYDESIIFEISSFASTKILPGNATREEIKEEDFIDFHKLHSFEKWRQKLHDNWIAPFSVDNHNWNSVTHYLIAQKFDANGKYFQFFTAESNTPISKITKFAIAAGSKSGKLKNKVLRPTDIQIVKSKISKKKYRKALLAKFEQNEDLKDILLSTKNAKLVYYKKGRHSIIADDLMIVRNILNEQKLEC